MALTQCACMWGPDVPGSQSLRAADSPCCSYSTLFVLTLFANWDGPEQRTSQVVRANTMISTKKLQTSNCFLAPGGRDARTGCCMHRRHRLLCNESLCAWSYPEIKESQALFPLQSYLGRGTISHRSDRHRSEDVFSAITARHVSL